MKVIARTCYNLHLVKELPAPLSNHSQDAISHTRALRDEGNFRGEPQTFQSNPVNSARRRLENVSGTGVTQAVVVCFKEGERSSIWVLENNSVVVYPSTENRMAGVGANNEKTLESSAALLGSARMVIQALQESSPQIVPHLDMTDMYESIKSVLEKIPRTIIPER
jgi:hypothetical protein